MKRRIGEVDDTADSKVKRPEGIASRDSLDNFWTIDKDDLLLKEIGIARSRQGWYSEIRGWNKETWLIMLDKLGRVNPDFRLLTTKHLKERQTALQFQNSVNCVDRVPPVDERDRLFYYAFEEPDELPRPPLERKRTARSRSRGVNVNDGNTRKTTNTNNLNNGESSSSARHSGI